MATTKRTRSVFFHKQILMALDGEMLSVSSGINYTMGDVARGDDTGGSNNPAVGAAATVATINRAHAVRARHVLQKINKHILNPDTKEKDGHLQDELRLLRGALALVARVGAQVEARRPVAVVGRVLHGPRVVPELAPRVEVEGRHE